LISRLADRTLGCRPRPYRVGYAFAAQEWATLPEDPWDVPLDAVVTEKGVRRCRS